MQDKTESVPRFAAAPADKHALEEGAALTPRFDSSGLVTAVVTDSVDGTVLMLAHMNREALALTLSTGIAHYYSRSRATLWKKGESSGNVQTVHEIRTDCDQDAVWLKVSVSGRGATCHTGRRSCFYRRAEMVDGAPVLVIDDAPTSADPDTVR